MRKKTVEHPIWGTLTKEGNFWTGETEFTPTGDKMMILIEGFDIESQFEIHQNFWTELIERFEEMVSDIIEGIIENSISSEKTENKIVRGL